MSARRSAHPWILVWSSISLMACSGSKTDASATASACGGTCPAGTWRDEVRQTRRVSRNRVDFVEGSCSWSCVALTECPAGMVPVITADCFTCARAMPGGSAAGGDCDSETWFANRSDAPDGSVAMAEIGGSAEREERIRFDVGDGSNLAFDDNSMDGVFSLLVLHFAADPQQVIAEMCRVAKPGAPVAAAVWYTRGGLVFNRIFYDVAATLDPAANEDRARIFTLPMTRPGELASAWHAAGLEAVEDTSHCAPKCELSPLGTCSSRGLRFLLANW